MKLLTIIGGVNGVGKSSIYGALNLINAVNEVPGVIIDTDKITAQLGGDKLKGGKEAVRLINGCLERGESFTWETTLSGNKPLKTILAAREKGYMISLYYIAVSTPEESLLRIQNRVRKGGHDIPVNDVQKRYEKRFDDLIKVLPHCDSVQFIDNENGFVKVGYYDEGKPELIGEYTPDWIVKLKERMT